MLVLGKDMKLGDVVNYQGARYEVGVMEKRSTGDGRLYYFAFGGAEFILKVYFEETYNVVERESDG